MIVYFSAENKAFYVEEVNVSMPPDAIELSDYEIKEYQLSFAPAGKILGSDGAGRPVWLDKPEPTQEELDAKKAKSEHAWVKSELDAVTVELMYHWTGDNRASKTEQAWKSYAIALRDYTSKDDDDNPVVVGSKRPSINEYV